MNNNANKIVRKLTKKKSCITRQKTFQNHAFIDFDKDISEMNVNIKEYQTLKKKNSFLDSVTASISPVKLNNKLNRINTVKNKNFDTYSITTNSSIKDKTIKKVTFSTVEIIRVEKYKKYNIMNTVSKTCIQKNMEEVKNKNSDQTSCLIF